MGHIKEPEGVDFVIKSKPLTKEEETLITNYIKAYKEKSSAKQKLIKQIKPKKVATV